MPPQGKLFVVSPSRCSNKKAGNGRAHGIGSRVSVRLKKVRITECLKAFRLRGSRLEFQRAVSHNFLRKFPQEARVDPQIAR